MSEASRSLKITVAREKYLTHVAQDLKKSSKSGSILEALRQTNQKTFEPPLPDEVVAQIYRDVTGGWEELPDPHIYRLHIRPASVPAILEGMRRLVAEDDETEKSNGTTYRTFTVEREKDVCLRLQTRQEEATIPIEMPGCMDIRTLQLVEEAGVRVTGDPQREIDSFEAIHFANSRDLDRIFYHAKTTYLERVDSDGIEINFDESLRKTQEALAERTRGYLEHGDTDTEIIEALINEDRGRYFWEIRVSDIIAAAKDAVQRLDNNARLQNNPFLRLTPAGVAERFVDEMRNEIRYVYDLKVWRVWTGVRWEDDPAEARIQKKIKAVVSNLAKDAAVEIQDEKMKEAVTRFFKTLLSNGGIKGLIEIVARDEKIATSYNLFDANPYLLNFENCVYDLRTFTYRPHNPADLITNVAGQGIDPDTGEVITARYDPQADCPLWKASLEEWFPRDNDLPLHGDNVDRETLDALQIRMGYCLSGNAIEDDFLTWYGMKGRNGKGVCKDIALAVLGSYATVADRTLIIETYEAGKGGSRGDLKNLIGKRLIFVDELKRKDQLDCAFIKDWCGHGIISFRPPYGADQIHMRPAGSMILLTNNLGSIESADSIWDRLRIVPWTKYFGEGERKKSLRSDLFLELPGIVNWFIEGYRKYVRLNRLPESDAMHAARIRYMETNNPLADWIVDEMILSSDPVIPKAHKHKIVSLRKDLYTTYLAWAMSEGYDKKEYLGRTTFYRELEDKYRGVIKLVTIEGGRYYQGIRLRAEYERNKHTL